MGALDIAVPFVARFEGFAATVYDDGTGVATIGWGETDPAIIREWRGRRMPRDVAAKLLRKRLAYSLTAVRRIVKVPLTDRQAAALTSFAYNVGEGALASSTLARKLNAGDYRAVPGELNKWVRGGGRVMGGLVVRRKAEGALFASGAPRPVLLPLELRYVRGLRSKDAGRRKRARVWLEKRRSLIQARARSQRNGWKVARRGARFQVISRALAR